MHTLITSAPARIELADLLAHLLGAVDDVVRLAGVVDADDARHVCTARLPRVAVTARLAENRDRDLHAGPGREPACLRRLDAEVAATSLADGRDAGSQRARHSLGGEVEVHRERCVHRWHRVEVAVDHEVHVAVDEAGIHGMARCVDCFIAVESRADLDDPLALDDDIGDGRGTADAVEYLAACDHNACHARHATLVTLTARRCSPRSEVGVDALRESGRVPAEQGDGLTAGEPIGHPADVRHGVMQRLAAARTEVGDVGQQAARFAA